MGKMDLARFSDNDYAGDRVDRKSTSKLGVIKKNVTLSSCETEYIALTTADCQQVWLLRLIEELMRLKIESMYINVDNKSAI